MPEMSGVELQAELHKRRKTPHRVPLRARRPAARGQDMKDGAFDFIQKPPPTSIAS